jgi:hypothetical protein
MYFAAISEENMRGWRPFSNYLFSIAEWHLKRGHEPLEITARKIRKYYPDQAECLEKLRFTLYEGFIEPGLNSLQAIPHRELRAANPTLDAVARLCASSRSLNHGVQSVITYNYDCLLEFAVGTHPHEPIYREQSLESSRMPIYHVHGYVPLSGEGSSGDEIVFTEDQYHLTAQNAYCWSNLVQIQAMSRSVGLMIGLSLSDRNMRRILDAIKKAPVGAQNFALLQRTRWEEPTDEAVYEIHQTAIKYLDRFARSGAKRESHSPEEVIFRPTGVKSVRPGVKSGAGSKMEPRYRHDIRGILREVERFDSQEQEYILDQLGICPIWYDDHDEIPGIIDQILVRNSPAKGKAKKKQRRRSRKS